jgi:hypothetical protein
MYPTSYEVSMHYELLGPLPISNRMGNSAGHAMGGSWGLFRSGLEASPAAGRLLGLPLAV